MVKREQFGIIHAQYDWTTGAPTMEMNGGGSAPYLALPCSVASLDLL